MDRQEFESTHYQRVYQYLRRHIEQCDLDRFSYNGKVEGNPANCLKIILQWVKNFSVANCCLSFPLLFSLYSLPFAFHSAHVVCETPHGLRFAILSNFWMYNCSLVRRLYSVTKRLLEMSWLVSRVLWSSLWFECPGYVSRMTLYVALSSKRHACDKDMYYMYGS